MPADTSQDNPQLSQQNSEGIIDSRWWISVSLLWQVYYFPGEPGRFMMLCSNWWNWFRKTFFGQMLVIKVNMKQHAQYFTSLMWHISERDGIFSVDRTCFYPRFKVFLYFISHYSHLVFEEPEDPSNRSFFSEIISSISDVKFSHSGRYLMTRDYLTVKVWDLNMESKPLETYQVRHFMSLHLTKYWLFLRTPWSQTWVC